MNLFQRLRGALTRSNPLNNPAIPLNSNEAFRWLQGGTISEAGEVVNEHTLLSISTAYACIRVLSESVASLPCKLYRTTERGRTLATEQRLHYLLTTAPNEEMTAFTFFEVLVKSMAVCGNAYAEIERNGAGDVIALWPLHPRETQPVRLDNGRLAYRTTDGMTSSQSRTIMAENILHVPLFPAFDGLVGMSPLSLSMQTFGHAIATEKYGARFFRNSATPALAIEIDAEVDGKDKALMRQEWEALQSGGNTHRIAVLDQGQKLTKLGFAPEEAQYLETRKFLREEIAAIYNVPVHRVGDNTKLANASIEGQNLSFVVDSLRPYLSRIENEFARKLFPGLAGVPTAYVIQFDVSERQRGDFASSMAGFASGRQWGYLTANDVRRALGLNEGGPELDVFLNPVNMQNAERLLSAAPSQSEEAA
jgi:HK97 family phage portal protein